MILVDVTLRDGGYVNGHSWSGEQAAAIVSACVEAQIPYCEVGYFRPRRHDTDGAQLPTASCPPDYLRRLRADHSGVTLVAMAHAADVELTDYARLADAGVGLVRLPAAITVLPKLGPHVEAAHQAGMKVTINLIRVSELAPSDIVRATKFATSFEVDAYYLADSNGSLFPEDVDRLITSVRETTEIPLGFHAHDGLSLAFINSLTARKAGCEYLDASLNGMGKGGGNLSLELIAGYLRAREGAPFGMTPLSHAAAAVLRPWRGDDVMARCESIASSLLDINLDSIKAMRAADNGGELVSLVDDPARHGVPVGTP
ncbi:MAG TPA: hypothetical protein VE465_26710 [Streptosporangiaceae bacterium]|jgi:4-hydroxy 2-oxovalerate aldolase|nr:hypothetical protein [Streptosporangiaceae bacterium]